MMDAEARVAELLRAPLGCAFLLIARASGLVPEAVAEPAVSVRLAAAAAREIGIWRMDHAAAVDHALRQGRQHADLARAILEWPTSAWWYGPLDIERQVWLSRTGAPPTPAALPSEAGSLPSR